MSTVLTRVGIGGELRTYEIEDVNSRFGLDKHFVFEHANFFSWDQQAVIMSLARRIVAGHFPDAHCDESFNFVFDRVFAFRGDPEWQARIKDVRVPFADYYQILQEFHTWRASSGIEAKLHHERRRRQKEYDDLDEPYNEDDLNYEVFQPLEDEDMRLFRKYGWICTATVWGVSNGVKGGKGAIDDMDYVRRSAKCYLSEDAQS